MEETLQINALLAQLMKKDQRIQIPINAYVPLKNSMMMG